MSSLKTAYSYTSVDINTPVKLLIDKEAMAEFQPETLVDLFYKSCQTFKEKPALAFTNNENPDQWTFVTYSQYYDEVKHCAKMLVHLGVQPRSCVAVLASNCPEWFYVELATITIGGVCTGIYPYSSPEAVYHTLNATKASVCVVDTLEQLKKLQHIKHRLPNLKAIIQINEHTERLPKELSNVWQWSTLYNMNFDERIDQHIEKCADTIYANECALIFYTSGTINLPKGVLISHDNVINGCKETVNILSELKSGQESIISYLPLNHMAGNLLDIFFSIGIGACTYFADSEALRGTLFNTIKKVRPSVFCSVPRFYEKIQEKLQALQTHKSKHAVKELLGLDNIKCLLVGSAPSSKELKNYFYDFNMPIYDIYGLTETSGAFTLNKNCENFDSVGQPLPGVEIKIFEPNDQGVGEICCRGRRVFMGYLDDPIKTKEAIDDEGWLHTGDLGFLDSDGNLILNGRIKDLIITSGGENIPPARIENLVKKELPCISNACVIGDQHKYLTILLTFKTKTDSATGQHCDELDPDVIDWLNKLGMKYEKLSDIFSENKQNKIETILAALKDGLKKVNEQALSNAQHVQYFTVLPRDFSIAADELGPILKMKRYVILKNFAKIIDKMYEPGFTNQLAQYVS